MFSKWTTEREPNSDWPCEADNLTGKAANARGRNEFCDISGQTRLTNMNGKKLLVVDDDPVILKALSLKLKANGYEVFTATDGAVAVNAVRTQKPDLILLDLTFPPEVTGVPWDGFRIMDWLKRIEEAAGIPIVVITGGDPAKYEARAKAGGATAFFRKPIDHDGLLTTIEQTLGAAKAAN